MMDYKDPVKRQNVIAIVEARNGVMEKMNIHKGDGKTESFDETWQCQLLTIPDFEKSMIGETVFNISGNMSTFDATPRVGQSRMYMPKKGGSSHCVTAVSNNNNTSFTNLLDRI